MGKLISIWEFICRRKYLITIEQIAREKYLMKKPNEDIYVFED